MNGSCNPCASNLNKRLTVRLRATGSHLLSEALAGLGLMVGRSDFEGQVVAKLAGGGDGDFLDGPDKLDDGAAPFGAFFRCQEGV